MSTISDPLGIRAATAWTLERARDVQINDAALDRLADALLPDAPPAPPWRQTPHWWNPGDPAATAQYVLLLDALNFSFWGEPRWRVRWRGQDLNGYWALAAALRRGIEEGQPLWEPRYLQDGVDVAHLLRGEDGVTIPLLAERSAILAEVATALERYCCGSFLRLVREANNSATAVVRSVVACFPSFRDVARYEGRAIPFYKRAQILAADLWGALEGKAPAAYEDLAALTMFADYKVPQVLQDLGVLTYSERLLERLLLRRELPPGSPAEVEIRAASVQAVEHLCDRLASGGERPTALQVDAWLWQLGQTREMTVPYHRTRSIYY